MLSELGEDLAIWFYDTSTILVVMFQQKFVPLVVKLI